MTPKQRAYLRSLSHSISPIVMIGKDGIKENVIKSVNDAFNTKELIKIKVLESAPESSKSAAQSLLEVFPDLTLVAVVGRIVIVYKQHPDKPVIVLPEKNNNTLY